MMLFCFLAVYLFFLYVPLKQSMHMFQQNRYNKGRYQTWLVVRYPLILEADCENTADADAELQPSFAAADFHAGGSAADAGCYLCLHQL